MATGSTPKQDEKKIIIMRQQDGRHAVTDALGNVVGLHNSPISAARQASLYFGHPTAEPMEAGTGAPAAHLAQQAQMQKAVADRAAAVAANPGMNPAPHPYMAQLAALAAARQAAATAAPQIGTAIHTTPNDQLRAGMAMGKLWMGDHPNSTPQQTAAAADQLRAVAARRQGA